MMRALDKSRRLKTRIEAGEPVLGTQLGLNDPSIIELFGRAGYDWAVIDTEHSAHTPVTVKHMLQAALGWDIVPFVRPQILDHDAIRMWLDIGATAILCPFIETQEDAQRLVDACRYPPRGKRGWNPRRAADFGLSSDEYLADVEDSLIILIIIESRLGAENAEAILGVEGIDGVTVGPMDLSMDLGVFRQWDAPAYVTAVDQIRAACAATGKALGSGVYSEAAALQCIRDKETLLLVTGDEPILGSGAVRVATELREYIAQQP